MDSAIAEKASATQRMPHADGRVALRVLQAGGIAVIMAAAPYKTFDLDRFFVPKELVLGITALVVTLLCAARVKRVALSRADQLLALWLLLAGVSALFATNQWLAGRATALSLAGVACFWCSRALARAGHARALVAALALAGVVGAATALLQAYGLKTEFVSLNRAPGGTFGNRNFMAHLCVIALPALLFSALRAPSRASFTRWCGGIAVVTGALILSRSRAAWLALVVGMIVLLVTGILALRRGDGFFSLRRLLVLLAAAGAGGGVALGMPNTLDWNSNSPYTDTAHSIVNYQGGSGRGRLIQYRNSLRMTLHHPLLGVGPGNWPVIYPRFASENDPSLGRDGMTSNPWPSSDWVTFLSERGPVAFVLLGLAMLALLTDGVRGLRTGTDTEARRSAAVFLATLVIAGRAGFRPCRLRTHLQQTHRVDPADRPATCAKCFDLDHRNTDAVAQEVDVLGHVGPPVTSQRDVKRRAAHIDGDDVLQIPGLANIQRGLRGRSGAGVDGVDRLVRHHRTHRQTPI